MTQAAPEMTFKIKPDCGEHAAQRGFSAMAKRMVGSSILTIAAEIRTLVEAGFPVANLTVGDFDPKEFPIPPALENALRTALDEKQTNYPPAPGLPELREAIVGHIRRTQDLDYPLESVVVFGGARPGLYSTYRLLLDPGETVLFPVPSWNNTNYCDVCRVQPRVLKCGPDSAFQPTAAALAPLLPGTRLVVLNSPQNPSGGVMPPSEMEAIGRLLVDENRRREGVGERPLYLMLDQIYRALVFAGSRHVSPVQMVPECAPFVVHIDGISKFCAATGLRVGWVAAPSVIAQKISALLTHVGAWAPRPSQAATASLLANHAACSAWETDMTSRVEERLRLLHGGLMELKAAGLPVQAIAPQGAIYISVRFALAGRRTPGGGMLRGNEDVRAYLLKEAGFGLVPFSAFGVAEKDEDGWFRASVGAVSRDAIRESIPRLKRALSALA